eukprot:CAMPEP_0172499440 /NCGR_PEP_ID=MMETSP1066-20121228/127158_1 /TAXON_ID=671091 /ORGANISM="Coscinodiscus wailesii, Strain CCMP2513" /LENGTH=121 /DNA_ID=CAMNT_0013273183 /DNA_START=97 /DNA_END=462 /DNA_ORIENTATION=+
MSFSNTSLRLVQRHARQQLAHRICQRTTTFNLYKQHIRPFSSDGSSNEAQMSKKLRDALDTDAVTVTDTSGGCGSMYKLEVSSEKFRGISMVKQHRMVQDVIRREIGEMHGLTISTKVPKA